MTNKPNADDKRPIDYRAAYRKTLMFLVARTNSGCIIGTMLDVALDLIKQDSQLATQYKTRLSDAFLAAQSIELITGEQSYFGSLEIVRLSTDLSKLQRLRDRLNGQWHLLNEKLQAKIKEFSVNIDEPE